MTTPIETCPGDADIRWEPVYSLADVAYQAEISLPSLLGLMDAYGGTIPPCPDRNGGYQPIRSDPDNASSPIVGMWIEAEHEPDLGLQWRYTAEGKNRLLRRLGLGYNF